MMNRRTFAKRSALAGAGLGMRSFAAGQDEESSLDAALDAVSPHLKKWASVCEVRRVGSDVPKFVWTDYRESGTATDFWPASTIKVYAVVAALEFLNERGFSLDTVATFEHRGEDGRWVLDCARSVREMISENFRRSSNEDYTLLLRLVGIDRINMRFLVPERGFQRSALMRGYVAERPWKYVREEPQRIRLRSADGLTSESHEHLWSGKSYAEERGCTVIDSRTGNVTTTRDLVECLRRILHHQHLPENQKYHLTKEQLEFLRHGGAGLTGLETRVQESGPHAWTAAVEAVFPQARFYHKCGLISNFALELAAVDDSANDGPSFLFAPVVSAGSSSTPVPGEKVVGEMARAIALWVQSRHARATPALPGHH